MPFLNFEDIKFMEKTVSKSWLKVDIEFKENKNKYTKHKNDL